MRNIIFLLLLTPLFSIAQNQYKTEIILQPNEKWWGGFVGLGHNMPFEHNLELQDLAVQNYNNQNAPLLISSNGRYVWSDDPFKFSIQDNKISLFYEN